MSDTRKELVEDLEHLLAHAKPGATKRHLVEEIIDRAKRGEFHDYKSPHIAPKVMLVTLLRNASLGPLARRVIDGEFDEPADAEDCANMSAMLVGEPGEDELREMLKLPRPAKS